MGRQQMICVSDKNDLQGLLWKYWFMPTKSHFYLNLLKDDPGARLMWQERIAKYLFACGCIEGGVLVLVFFLYWLMMLFMTFNLAVPFFIEQGIVLVVGAVGSAFAGKIVGVLYARFRLLFAIRQVKRLLPASSGSKGASGGQRGATPLDTPAGSAAVY